MSMESKGIAQETALQTDISSGSSSSSTSSSFSSSVDSHVDTSINGGELEVREITTSHVVDGEVSDGGSENEGFISGEEEFESAVDRPIVGYLEDETLEKSIQGEENGSSLESYSDFSTPISVRPIAKVSVDSDTDDEDDNDVSGVDFLADESVRRNEEVVNELAGEIGFSEAKGSEAEIRDENEEKEILLSGESESLAMVLNEGGANDTQEQIIELAESLKEGKLPENELDEDVSSVPDENLNAGKQVPEEVQLNDAIVKEQPNEVPDGKDAQLEKGTLQAEKQSGGMIILNGKVTDEDEVQLSKLETDKTDLGEQEDSEVFEIADAFTAGEQLKELETGVSADDETDLNDQAQASSQVLEISDEFTSGVSDEQNLHVSSVGSETAAVSNMEELKGLENKETEDVVKGGAVVHNGSDKVVHGADKVVGHNAVASNSETEGKILENNNEVVTEGLHVEGAGDAVKDDRISYVNVEDQQDDVNFSENTMRLLVSPDEAGQENVLNDDSEIGQIGAGQENDLNDDSEIGQIVLADVETESTHEAKSLVEEAILDNASAKDISISDPPGTIEPMLSEVDGEHHHSDDEGEIEGSVTDGETDGLVFGSSEAAKQFLEELERGSGAGSHSGAESSHDHSQRIDGQIVTDSDEVDTDDEGDGKELFDSAALAALLKAARDAGSDGGPITVTSQDGSRLFSIERPAGLGSSLTSLKNASRPSRPQSFTPSNPRMGDDAENKLSEEEKNKLEKLQQIRVSFLRLVQRLGVSLDDSLVAQVLYRFGLVAGRSTSELFSIDNAKNTAIHLEAGGKEDLDFSLNILVLGKTGVGKSATINSILGEDKTPINAFGPGTTMVKEIVGAVEGVKIRIFDSPGLRSSSSERSINQRILTSIKKVMRKFPPDIVLYVDRLDNQTRDLNDLLLLRSVSSSLGSSIWKNAIITLTHAASAPPDGPSGSPLGYEVFVAQRSHVLQQSVAQAVGDLRILNPTLMNPVSLVENHPSCRKNRDGQKVLPNGQNWRAQLLLLCFSIKILAEVGNLSKAPESFDHRKLFGLRARSPPLPYLLSGLLQSRTHPKLSSDIAGENIDSDIDLADLSDSDQEEEEEEYDQLPPFKPLRKSQIAKLSKEQRKAYSEEYDYRVKLLQKKQWKEELKRMKEIKKKGQPGAEDFGYLGEDDPENSTPAAVQVPLPDMVLPPSFDGDSPAYRFRFLEPTSQFLARPVLDTHGWDHDCGYDGVNLEHSMAIVNQFPTAVSVQITKDKKEFNIHLDSSVSAKHGENGSTMAGFDIQNIGRQLAYILRGETKFKNFRKNRTAAGVSVTFLGENVCPGFKVEDQITIGKRVVLVGSTGTVRSQGDSAFGANLEMRLREADFPIGQDQSSLGLSLVKWRGDMALGANFQSQFSIGRSYKMAIRAGLNNKLSGQISVRTSSSDQLQIALLAILPVVRAIYNTLRPGVAENYSTY